jgi:hypothetical protein
MEEPVQLLSDCSHSRHLRARHPDTRTVSKYPGAPRPLVQVRTTRQIFAAIARPVANRVDEIEREIAGEEIHLGGSSPRDRRAISRCESK